MNDKFEPANNNNLYCCDFLIWKLFIYIAIARTWTWCSTSSDEKERSTYFFSFGTISRITGGAKTTALRIIIIPLNISLAIIE